MMASIPSLSILNSNLSGSVIGFGITKLHPRSIFQSIGDFFARKSGNERISFLVVTDQGIKNFHTRGNDILEINEISTSEISNIQTWNKSKHDPQQLDVQITTQKPGKKEGEVISNTYDFEIFPAFLGINASKIETLSEIVEHKKQFEQLIQYFSSWKAAN